MDGSQKYKTCSFEWMDKNLKIQFERNRFFFLFLDVTCDSFFEENTVSFGLWLVKCNGDGQWNKSDYKVQKVGRNCTKPLIV